MERKENYWWLIDADLSGWKFIGCSVDHVGLHQYDFIDQKGQLQFMYHKEFKKFIGQHDLATIKKNAVKNQTKERGNI